MNISATAAIVAVSLYEGLLKLKEQQAAPNMAAVAPVASPVQPTQQMPGTPPPVEAPPQEPQQAVISSASLESIIDSLNVIRGGPSFEKPEVFNGLTAVFNGLSEVEKAATDKVLKEIQNVMIGKAGNEQMQQGAVSPASMTPPQQMMQASQRAANVGPAPATGGM